jgi:two-component system, response regulator PdtaR
MAPEPKAQRRPARVLLVEDEPLVRMLLADELREAGLTVVEAATAGEALSFLAVSDEVDVVVTDIQMPGGMDGLELAARIRQTHPAIPIVLTSGNPPPVNLSRVGPFLMKPYTLHQAVQVVVASLPREEIDGDCSD